MDISLKETTLLQVAHAKGCLVIPGIAMYVRQAEYQDAVWASVGP